MSRWLVALVVCASAALGANATRAAIIGDDFACVKQARTLTEAALAVEWQPDESADYICFDLYRYADILNRETGMQKSPQQWGTFIRSNQVRQNVCQGEIEPYYHKDGSVSTFKRTCKSGEQVLEFTLDDPASPNARWRPFIAMECLNPLRVTPLPLKRMVCQPNVIDVQPRRSAACVTGPGIYCAAGGSHYPIFDNTSVCNNQTGVFQ
jgi:hypothetical protein